MACSGCAERQKKIVAWLNRMRDRLTRAPETIRDQVQQAQRAGELPLSDAEAASFAVHVEQQVKAGR